MLFFIPQCVYLWSTAKSAVLSNCLSFAFSWLHSLFAGWLVLLFVRLVHKFHALTSTCTDTHIHLHIIYTKSLSPSHRLVDFHLDHVEYSHRPTATSNAPSLLQKFSMCLFIIYVLQHTCIQNCYPLYRFRGVTQYTANVTFVFGVETHTHLLLIESEKCLTVPVHRCVSVLYSHVFMMPRCSQSAAVDIEETAVSLLSESF